MNPFEINGTNWPSVIAPIYMALLHSPVLNRKGERVVTAVTNMDIHDLSRTARTYGARAFFLVNPLSDQHEIVGQILHYWTQQKIQEVHPDRFEAVSLVRLAYTLDEVKQAIEEREGVAPKTICTDAKSSGSTLAFRALREQLRARCEPVLIVFGTGFGVEEAFKKEVDAILEPIEERADYNHLSVRAAAGIIMDRLLGTEGARDDPKTH